MCPNCDVTLTYHRGDECSSVITAITASARRRSVPPAQASTSITLAKAPNRSKSCCESVFRRLRIGRIDRDTKSRRHEFEQTLLDFGKGELDMLVGTQMLAKGHDFPNVTLVGVVSVDAGLALPDFRAAERTFQLITQVAGRAGRGDFTGTRADSDLSSASLRSEARGNAQDYSGLLRRRNSAPAQSWLSALCGAGDSCCASQGCGPCARDRPQQLRSALIEADTARSCRVLGPAPAPLARFETSFVFSF